MKANATTPLVITGFVGFIVYLIIVLTGSTEAKFDEPIHLGSVLILDQYGFGSQFLRHLPAGPGPLFPLLHHLLAPLTGLHPPWVRLVNPVLFLGIIALLNRLGGGHWLGINMMGTPFISITIGMALTEIPSMFCLCASLWFLFHALENKKFGTFQALTFGLIGGLLLGLAMWGRQTYIIALPAYLALWRTRRDFFTLALYVIAALAMIVPLFLIWKGLVPPFAQDAESGLKFDHGFFAFAFLGLATVIIEPRFFLMPWQWLIGIALVAGIVNFSLQLAIIYPMDQLMRRILPPSLLPTWIAFASTVFAILAAVTLAAFVRQAWNCRHQARPLFAIIATGLLLFGCIKVTQSISSRYVTAAMPFWLIGLQPLMKDDRWKPYRFALAIVIGAVILWGYLHSTVAASVLTVPTAQ